MISKEFVYNKVLPLIKEQSRMLEYYLIQSLFENRDKEIIAELKTFQNDDGGFGNGLEPDVQMPHSSVVATDIAVHALDFVKDQKLKEPLIKDIVEYYENVYDEENGRFWMVSKEVDDYPRAIWWNYEDIANGKNFPFGNPDPEVIGFLFENRRYVKKLNYSKLINKVVGYVQSEKFMDAGMHTLMSVMNFYNRVDTDVKNLIHDQIHKLATKEINAGIGKWEEYALEPYKLYVINPHFVNTHLQLLGENLEYNMSKLVNLDIGVNWSWFQYLEEFEQVKDQWLGQLYFNLLYAFRLHHII